MKRYLWNNNAINEQDGIYYCNKVYPIASGDFADRVKVITKKERKWTV